MTDRPKYKDQIAEKTYPILKRYYPAIKIDDIKKAIDNYYENKPVSNHMEKIMLEAIKTIEQGLKGGWIK